MSVLDDRAAAGPVSAAANPPGSAPRSADDPATTEVTAMIDLPAGAGADPSDAAAHVAIEIADADAIGGAAPPRRGRSPGSIMRIVGPIGVFAIVIALWLYVSEILLDEDRRFLLPPPQRVISKGVLDTRNLTEILQALWSTVEVALVGLLVAIVLGVAFAIIMSQAKWLERSFFPYAVALQTVPILAIVPLLGFWFGFEFRSRVIVCVLIAIFPIITNTLFGLQSVDPDMHDLFTLCRASRRQRLWHLQLPAALPSMITGFKISAGLSVIGAIIADFFFRQGDPGIGRLIDVYRQRLATEQLLTALIFSSLVGLLIFFVFDIVGSRIQRQRSAKRAALRR